MKIDLPQGEYIKSLVVNDDHINIDFEKRKKVALLFICLNERYWPYLKQVVEDCRKNFLPQHNVEYFVWTDLPTEDTPEFTTHLSQLLPNEELFKIYQDIDEWPNNQFWGRELIRENVDWIRTQKDIHIIPTGSVDWPAPTLMRYHLFLNEEERLRDFEYVFYMDADMKVVSKVSDEIFGEGLTAAPHPGYELAAKYIPPYEPNSNSTAYIHRLGRVVDEKGKPRFRPFYAAGGFQGGVTKDFLEAMKVMKANIDKDFNKNYVAIWNDESHWNKYLWDYYKGNITFLDQSYVYPDSLIKEYYEPLWGRSFEPRIITLTKHFTISKQGGEELSQMIGVGAPHVQKQQKSNYFKCTKCGVILPPQPGHQTISIQQCDGPTKPHKIEMIPLK